MFGRVEPTGIELTSVSRVVEPSIALDASVSRIKRPDCEEIENVHERMVRFFGRPRLLYDGDVFVASNSDSPTEFFKISLKESPLIVSRSTNVFQSAAIVSRYPAGRVDTERSFVSRPISDLIDRVCGLLQPVLCDESSSGPIVLVVAGSEGYGRSLLLNRLCDLLSVNHIELDCFDFWSAEGKSTEAEIDEAVQKVANFAPCVCSIDNVWALAASPDDVTTGSRSLDLLAGHLRLLPSNVAVVLTCLTSELPTVPQELASLVHFEFVVDDLSEEDRCQFARFAFGQRRVDVEEKWFANNTRGFTLEELNQVVEEAKLIALEQGRHRISRKDVEHAIQERNKSFAEAVGVPKVPTVTWDDVGGLDDVKQIIAESLQLDASGRAATKTLKRSGIVLYGPPGCGKTLIAKAVANEFNMTFLGVKGPELLNQYVGQSEQNLRNLFEKARLASPSIVFFDELDSLAPNRGAAGDSGGVMDRMVSQLLSEMDTIHAKKSCDVFVMAATNRPDLLDPCLLTPGRFDKIVHVRPANDLESKIRILRPVCRKLRLEKGLQVEDIAAKCPELMSGADLTSLMQKASMNAVREVIERIESGALGIADAKVEVQMGQVEEALKEFTGSLSTAQLQRYSALENVL
ncbi:Protein PRX-6 [Aphelenchoides avenae]|nr:Protein PRX-6 [Aphelenchus avenae]